MQNVVFFPFADYGWFYLGFIVFVLLKLALGLGVFHRKAHAVSFKESLGWSICWFTLGMVKASAVTFSSILLRRTDLSPTSMHELNQVPFDTLTTVYTTHVRGND